MWPLLLWACVDLKRQWTRFLSALVLLVCAVFFFLILHALSAGIRHALFKPEEHAKQKFLIEITQQSMSFGFLEFKTPGLLGGRSLDESTIARVQALEHVKHVYVKNTLRLPVSAQGGAHLLGQSLTTDVVVEILDDELLAEDQKNSEPIDRIDTQSVLPVYLNEYMMDVFNQSIAPALHVPSVSRDLLIGMNFKITIGQSFLLGKSSLLAPINTRAQIAGFSPQAMHVGISLPRSAFVNLIRQQKSLDGKAIDLKDIMTPVSLLVWIDSIKHLASLTQSLEQLGLHVNQGQTQLKKLVVALEWLVRSSAVLFLIFVGLLLSHMMANQMLERNKEFAIHRAVGASRLQILGWLLWQAVLLAILSLLIGAFLSYGFILLGNHVFEYYAQSLIFRPIPLMIFEWWPLVVIDVLVFLCVVISTVWPVWFGTKQSPAACFSTI